jgi:tRNA uracil 4-sulfurtransferase
MTTFMVRYAEIALKGNNRRMFVQQLVQNICNTLRLPQNRVNAEIGQIMVHVDAARSGEARAQLAKVFGIAWFAEITTCASTLDAITTAALEQASPLLNERVTFAVRSDRATKSLPYRSADVDRQVGSVLVAQTGARVNLSSPDVTVSISISQDKAHLYTERIMGPGGLPVGVSGRVLSLLSGGFDSIAASYLLAKRGAQIDYLHFHVFPRGDAVMHTKMPHLWEKLSKHTLSQWVALANYAPFQIGILGLDQRHERYEVVVFRRLMVRVGQILAQKYGYDALVLGDSLGQVASQTMHNITAVDEVTTIPQFRPLIGMDKVEVVNLVRRLGLDEDAAAPYKDCCSIISSHPATKAHMPSIREIESAVNIDSIAQQIADEVEIMRVGAAPRVAVG